MDVSPPEPSQRPEPVGKGRTLLVRILAGLVLIPLVLFANYLGGLAFAVFVALLAALSSREFNAMFADLIPPGVRPVVILGSALICLAFHFGSLAGGSLAVTALLILVLLGSLLRQDRDSFAAAAGVGFIGLIYTGWLLGFFVLLRNMTGGPAGGSGGGRDYVLMVLIMTWSYDSLAYLGGSFLGRRKLFTRISPSKTVEGTLTGIAGSIAAALICKVTFAGYFGWAAAIGVGLVTGVAAQAGDLIESMFKRSARAKDSSHLIPGHGGMLDRSDSLLLTGPLFYLYIRMIS